MLLANPRHKEAAANLLRKNTSHKTGFFCVDSFYGQLLINFLTNYPQVGTELEALSDLGVLNLTSSAKKAHAGGRVNKDYLYEGWYSTACNETVGAWGTIRCNALQEYFPRLMRLSKPPDIAA